MGDIDDDITSTIGNSEKQRRHKELRAQQLESWSRSDVARAKDHVDDKDWKVGFDVADRFNAAAVNGDIEEVGVFLREGVDIDVANVDGLTALHQAVLNDDTALAEFLIENGADLNPCDNDGWTPLHAAASCGYLHLVKLLVEAGANPAPVNNDGELPCDIKVTEDPAVIEYLEGIIDREGIDVEEARNAEENQMKADSERWLREGLREETFKQHPKTGATPLHIAACKNYLEVMRNLLKCGADVNAVDFEGWTPLHAAATWNLPDAALILTEWNANFDAKNKNGLTPIDSCDTDMVETMKNYKAQQRDLVNDRLSNHEDLIISAPKNILPIRRSSVVRINREESEKKRQEDTALELRIAQQKAENIKKENVEVPRAEPPPVVRPAAVADDDVTSVTSATDNDSISSISSNTPVLPDKFELPPKKPARSSLPPENDFMEFVREVEKSVDQDVPQIVTEPPTPSIDAPKIPAIVPASSEETSQEARTDDKKTEEDRKIEESQEGGSNVDSLSVDNEDEGGLKRTASWRVKREKKKKEEEDAAEASKDASESTAQDDSSATQEGSEANLSIMIPDTRSAPEVDRKQRARFEKRTRRSTQGVNAADLEKALASPHSHPIREDMKEERERLNSKFVSSPTSDHSGRSMTDGGGGGNLTSEEAQAIASFSNQASREPSVRGRALFFDQSTVDTPPPPVNDSPVPAKSSSRLRNHLTPDKAESSSECTKCSQKIAKLEEEVSRRNNQLDLFKSTQKWAQVQQEKQERESLLKRVNSLEKQLSEFDEVQRNFAKVKSENASLIRLLANFARKEYDLPPPRFPPNDSSEPTAAAAGSESAAIG